MVLVLFFLRFFASSPDHSGTRVSPFRRPGVVCQPQAPMQARNGMCAAWLRPGSFLAIRTRPRATRIVGVKLARVRGAYLVRREPDLDFYMCASCGVGFPHAVSGTNSRSKVYFQKAGCVGSILLGLWEVTSNLEGGGHNAVSRQACGVTAMLCTTCWFRVSKQSARCPGTFRVQHTPSPPAL